MSVFGLALNAGTPTPANVTQSAGNLSFALPPRISHGVDAAREPRRQFRYVASLPAVNAQTANFRLLSKMRRAVVRQERAPQFVDVATLRRRLRLPNDAPEQTAQPMARAVTHYFQSCQLEDLTYERGALITGLSNIQEIQPSEAMAQLTRIEHAFKTVFFESVPAQRRSRWESLTDAAKSDTNLAINIFDAINTGPQTLAGATLPAHKIDNTPMLESLAEALSAPPDLTFPESKSPYLIALRNVLRELDAANNDFFHDHIAILPSDILDFVGLPGVPPVAQSAIIASAPEYLQQRKTDLAALRYSQSYYQYCTPVHGPLPDIASMRTAFSAAMSAEKHDAVIMGNMFLQTGDTSLISHSGISLRNAAGKDVNDLIAYLDAQADPAFLQLDAARKTRLVRIKLYRLEESPDYVIGSVQHSMATVLRRISDRPENNRYVRYRDRFHLLECWELRYKQWLERRDFELSPPLYSAMHSAGSTGLYYCNLSWYRFFWHGKILGPIANTTTVRDATPEHRAALWRWVEERSPGWSAESQRWRAITPDRYATSVTGMMEAFYNIQKATDLPRFVVTNINGAGYTLYHESLSGLSLPIRKTITELAKKFICPIFSVEAILSDDWITTSYRILENAQYRTALVMQEPPSYSVEVAAYLVLLNHGITLAQMTEPSTRVFCAGSDNAHQQRLRPAHDAFISVIRNAHSDDMLILPDGSIITPHAIINIGFQRYLDGLSTNAWVVGRARQNLRERGVPLLPSLLKKEIESVAAPFYKKASKATASGKELADFFFGALPISSPILQLSRAVRAGNYKHVPYYLLILARDIMAVAAMRGALGAAYLKPLQVASRYGTASLLGASALGTRRIASDPRGFMRSMNVNRDKSQDVAFSGDQAHSIQSKIIRRGNQNNAAHHYIASPIQQAGGEFKSQHFDPDDWENMMQVLLPLNLLEAERQRQKVRAIVTKNDNSLLNITMIEDAGETGARAGLLGLSQINANTLCDGKIMCERLTVLDTQDWRLKTLAASPRLASKLIGSHIIVTADASVEPTWQTHPDRRYDPITLLTDLYETSTQFFRMLHWYDDHAIERHTISIHISNNCTSAKVTQSPMWTTVDIELPANPERLPIIVTELRTTRQTILEATLECFIAAVTRVSAPAEPARERGVNIWLTNQILLESGAEYVPRINAATLNAYKPWEHKNISAIAEQEDQYLERIFNDYQLPPAHGRFQGEQIAKRPTVVDAIAALSRLDYPAHAQGKQSTAAMDPTPAGFKRRFEQKFGIDQSGCDAEFLQMIDLFLYECYVGSSLFQKLFDRGTSEMRRRWTIYPKGFRAMGTPWRDKLVPMDHIIDAGTERAVCQCLVQTTVDVNITLSNPAPQMQPIESMRRLMDGVVTALSGLDGNGTASPLRFDTTRHRGAVVWISDFIFWQAGWMANKRLARIVLSDSPANANGIARLTMLASANRRAARVEDTYILDWLYTA
jgi:hypothetical protein